MSEEFSRRVDVHIIKDVPLTLDQWLAKFSLTDMLDAATAGTAYAKYVERFQPYRWAAVAANNEPVAHGESYFNLADLMNAIELNYGDDTTAYTIQMYGDARGEKLLRYGKTDLNRIQGMSKDG